MYILLTVPLTVPVFIVFISRLNVRFCLMPGPLSTLVRCECVVYFYLRCARAIFHCIIHDANGKNRIETAHQANKMPKSSPMADLVSNIIVREALTTAQVSNFSFSNPRGKTAYFDSKARHTPNGKSQTPRQSNKTTSTHS